MTEQKTNIPNEDFPVDINRVLEVHDYTCQRCGRDGSPEGDKVTVAQYVGGDQSRLSSYEARCQKCDGEKNGLQYWAVRKIWYFMLFPAMVLGAGFPLIPAAAGVWGMYLTLGSGVPLSTYLYRFTVLPLLIILGLILFAIYVQIVVWVEPHYGLVYRSTSWVWERIEEKLFARLDIRKRGGRITANIRERLSIR
jgi:hypothetical protein